MTDNVISTKLRILTPDDGMALTDGSTYTTGSVYLAHFADASRWREISINDVPPQDERPSPPRTFSKLKLEDALFDAGVLDRVDAFIDAQTVTNEHGQSMPLRRKYETALEFSEGHPLFEPAVSALQSALGWTDEQVEAVLSAAEVR